MRVIRSVILTLLALVPLATLVHRDDVGRWDLQRSAMAAPDEFSYLLMARNFLHGGGLSLHQQLGQDTFYPPGYPLLLALWARCVNGGVMTAFMAHSLNAVLLGAAVVVVYFFSRRLLLMLAAADHPRFKLSPAAAANTALLVAGVFAANWHVLGLSLFIMSEPAFMLATFGWLALALKWPDWHHHAAKAAAVSLLAVIAWSMRGAGITCIAATALFPLLAWWRERRMPNPPRTARRLAALLIVLALPLLYQIVLTRFSPEKSLASGADSANSYTHQLFHGLADNRLPLTILSHMEDFASTFVPEPRENPDMQIRDVIGKCFLILGLAGWLMHLAQWLGGIKRSENAPRSFLELYLLLYMALYLLWPFNFARFWSPILPMMLVYAVIAIRSAGDGGVPRKAWAPLLLGLLFLLATVEDCVQLGNRARRLNYVSDSLRDAVRAIARQSADPLVAGMGADELFLTAWNFSQEQPTAAIPRVHIPRGEHADVMLNRLLDAPPAAGPRTIFFISYFPDNGNTDTRDTLANVAKSHPAIQIRRIFQKEIIVTVWKIQP